LARKKFGKRYYSRLGKGNHDRVVNVAADLRSRGINARVIRNKSGSTIYVAPTYNRKNPVAVKISKSNLANKKLKAVFTYQDESTTTTNFGGIKPDGTPYSDYTIHKDPKRKERYIARHKKNENWDDPTTAGALSRYILWEKTSLDSAISQFKRRFNLS